MLLALLLGAGACGAQGLSAPHSLLTTQTPAMIHLKDGPTTEYQLGVRFKSDATGEIRAIRFWKDLYERGTHVGRIWSATGTQLATVTFNNETASGWQEQALPTPLRIQANVEYMVSVNTASGFYVATNDSASQLRNGNLASVVESNGRYGPVGAYPAQSFQSSNYFRDVVFAAAESSSTDAGSGSSGSSGGTPSDAGTGSSGGTTPNADGIAARYPGDVGIEKDPNVVFADGFESYAQASDLWNKWNNYYQASQTRITTDPANVRTGTKALEFTMPQGIPSSRTRSSKSSRRSSTSCIFATTRNSPHPSMSSGQATRVAVSMRTITTGSTRLPVYLRMERTNFLSNTNVGADRAQKDPPAS